MLAGKSMVTRGRVVLTTSNPLAERPLDNDDEAAPFQAQPECEVPLTTNGLEAAIRNALARAGNPDREGRARVYQSARTAMQRSLEKQGAVDESLLAAQTARVEEVIERIEAEQRQAEFAATESGSAEAPDAVPAFDIEAPSRSDEAAGPAFADDAAGYRHDPEVDAPEVSVGRDGPNEFERTPDHSLSDPFTSNADGESATPSFSADREDRLATPVTSGGAASDDVGRVEPRKGKTRRSRRARKEKPRRSWKRSLFWLGVQLGVLALLVAGGLWWVAASGGLENAGEQLAETGAGLVESTLDANSGGGQAQRVGAGQFDAEWTPVLEPDGFDSVTPGGAVTVERIEEDEEPVLRIASVSAGEAGEVRVPLSPDVVEALRGRPTTIALTVSAGSDRPTQMSVRCTFDNEEACMRHRFDVMFEESDVLFDLSLPDTATGDGALVINSDIAGEGRPIDLHGIRMRPAN